MCDHTHLSLIDDAFDEEDTECIRRMMCLACAMLFEKPKSWVVRHGMRVRVSSIP